MNTSRKAKLEELVKYKCACGPGGEGRSSRLLPAEGQVRGARMDGQVTWTRL